MGGERSRDGLQERDGVEDVDERANDVRPEERARDGGGEMEIASKRSSGGTETGGVCVALGENRGRNKAGKDGSPTVGDPERGEMGVAGVYGIREVEHGRPTVDFQCAGGSDRRSE